MLQLQNKIEFENNCWVSLIDPSNWNSSEEARIKAVTDIASITTGRLGLPEFEGEWTKDVVDTKRINLYNRLLTESAGRPSTPFEFVPIVDFHYALSSFKFDKYCYFDSNNVRYSNLRNYLNNRFDKYNTPEELKGFKVIVGQVTWKCVSHLRTHRAFSWLVESSRNKKYLNNVEFWYPSWWSSETKYYFESYDKGLVNTLQTSWIDNRLIKPEEATMELSDRRLVKFAMCGWLQDTNSWDNLFAVRGKGTGTQSITGIAVETIKKLIYA